MKRLIGIVLLLLACWCMACKKAKGPANGSSVQPNNHLDSTVTMTAIINGVTWHTDSVYGYYVKSSSGDSAKMNLLVTATNVNNNSSIVFNITNYAGPATYPVNPPWNTITYYSGNNRYMATIGSIILATDTAYALRGTFTFTAGAIDATNGVFDVARP